MNRFYKSVLLLTFFFGSLSVRAADTLTVQDVMQRALQNHPAVQRALEDVTAAEARVGQSRSALYPTVDGVANYARIGPVPSIPFGSAVFELAPADNYDLHITGRYNLYDFKRTATQVDLSRSRVAVTADAVDAARSTLAYQAARAFYGVVYFQQALAVQDQQIAALNEHHDIAQKRVQTGVATNLDVLTTDVRVAAAQNQRVDLQNMLDKQITVLRELLGLPPQAPVTLRGTLEHTPVTVNEDSLMSVAYRQRTDLQIARDAEASARMQQRVTSLSDLPALNAFAQYGFKNGYEPHLHEWVSNWAVGGQLAVPVFSGKRKEFHKQEADANLRSQQENTRNIQRQIQSDIGRAVVDVKAAQSKIDIAAVGIERARAAIAVARSAYQYGTITNVDLLDAETSLAQANLIQLQALYSYELARYNLEQAIGVKVWEPAGQ
ncbi:MAG TPA: TolC family protein [bacterium]|jgi:outer membrane protein TolC